MSLTPIKVRGKRSSVQTESLRYSTKCLLNPRDKLPVSPASNFSSPPAKMPRHSNTRGENVGRQARFAAPLEQLPTELLETIFLHNMNLSLPQASPIIGSKLASKHVKAQLVFKVCSAGSFKAYPSDQAALFPATTDQADAQSAILRMKWMTLTFIRQLIPDYIVKTLVRELSARGLRWLGNGPLVTKETEPTIRQYLEDDSIRLIDTKQGDRPVFGRVSWRVGDPPRLLCLSFSFHVGMVTIEEYRIYGLESAVQYIRLSSGKCHKWRIFCGVNGCKIPRKLLHGPWTPDKCDFLEMVIRGNATVDWIGTTSGEIAEKGLMQALREGNARATRLLVTRAGPGNPRGLRGSPASSHDSDIRILDFGLWPGDKVVPASAFDERGVGVVPQTKHLRTAVVEAGCQQDIIKALLMAEHAKIDVEDRTILDCAVEKLVQDDERGSWLLSMLSSQGGEQEDAAEVRRKHWCGAF